jgi:hypothetical protein
MTALRILSYLGNKKNGCGRVYIKTIDVASWLLLPIQQTTEFATIH